IFFTGSYRKPREINWIIGTILLGLTLMAGFVGYSLPYDAYAVTATGIGYSIARSIPWIGGFVSQLFFGGAFPTLGSLARLYTIHVFILPAVITAVVGVHLLVIVKQKHTQPGYARKMAEPGKVLGVPLLPYQALLAGQLFLLMFGVLFVLSSLVTPHPVEAFGPPQAATPEVKPDWYLMWVYGFLKIMPAGASFRFLGATFSPDFLGGLLFPALVFGILTLAPWMDRTNRRAIRRFEYLEPVNQSPIRTGAGVAMLTLIGTMFIAAYYDQIGMSLGVIWSIVIVLPILAGIFAGLVAHTFRGQERFDPHEQLPRVSFAPEAPSPSEQLEAIKSAPTQLQPMRDDVVRTLHELGELAPYVRYLQGDEEIDDLLDTIEDLRTDLGDADGRLRNKVHTRSADGDGEQEPESS
ncbi:MAG TPA: cytochrome b, partial [Thermomicrobiales bacterium]|nr:cytochrome b [Thermomicrobiales bacterium]